jgi:hypothetical protein
MGCLLALVGLIVILIIAALAFGGFQTGTKAAGQHAGAGITASAAAGAGGR